MKIADSVGVSARIEQAFHTASASTGTSFDYLVKTAQRESAFDEDAKARTSSASGLFQFIESTWLETVKEAGPQHGLAHLADHIERTASGRYHVADPKMRQEILALRDNAEVASVMAGALTQKNAAYLRQHLGRDPSDGELYIAHFLGAAGARKLIEMAHSNPDQSASAVFSRQARANKSIFFHRDGAAKSMSEVYAGLVSKHNDTTTMIARTMRPEFSKVAEVVPETKPLGSASPTAVADLSMGDPTNHRVMTAFRAAAEATSPFHDLFRDSAGGRTSLKASFLSSFSVQEEAAERLPMPGAVSGSGDTSEEAREPRSARSQQSASSGGAAGKDGEARVGRQAIDLTAFLRYRPRPEQKDLLPPA